MTYTFKLIIMDFIFLEEKEYKNETNLHKQGMYKISRIQ